MLQMLYLGFAIATLWSVTTTAGLLPGCICAPVFVVFDCAHKSALPAQRLSARQRERLLSAQRECKLSCVHVKMTSIDQQESSNTNKIYNVPIVTTWDRICKSACADR